MTVRSLNERIGWRRVARLVTWCARLVVGFSSFSFASWFVMVLGYLVFCERLLYSHVLWILLTASAVTVGGLVCGAAVGKGSRLIVAGAAVAALGASCGRLIAYVDETVLLLMVVCCVAGSLAGARISDGRRVLLQYAKVGEWLSGAGIGLGTFGMVVMGAALISRSRLPGVFVLQPIFEWRLVGVMLGVPTVSAGLVGGELEIGVLWFPLAIAAGLMAAKAQPSEGHLVKGWFVGTTLAYLWLGWRWWKLYEVAIVNPAVQACKWLPVLWAFGGLILLAVFVRAWKRWMR